MSTNPIDDFVNSFNTINGHGFFEDNLRAVQYAHRMSKSQRKKYHKYGVIPSEFFAYLKEILGVKRKNNMNYRKLDQKYKVEKIKRHRRGEVTSLLLSTPYMDDESFLERLCLYKEILLYDFPHAQKNSSICRVSLGPDRHRVQITNRYHQEINTE